MVALGNFWSVGWYYQSNQRVFLEIREESWLSRGGTQLIGVFFQGRREEDRDNPGNKKIASETGWIQITSKVNKNNSKINKNYAKIPSKKIFASNETHTTTF